MALDPRQMPLRRPPAVAVHDDRDVGGQLLEVDLPRQRFVMRSRRNRRQELLKRHYGSFVSKPRVYKVLRQGRKRLARGDGVVSVRLRRRGRRPIGLLETSAGKTG